MPPTERRLDVMELEKLSLLQQAFDRTRGFSDLPDNPGAPGGDWLRKVEYSLIGLAGEVGEIANLVKRARRAYAQSGRALSLPQLSEEIADVLSYLLKLAAQADVDPTRAYLAKMCLNAHRFRDARMGPPRAVSLCGPPGSGKSTLAKLLAAKLSGASVYIEDYKNNPFLGDLQRPSFDVAASQAWFLDRLTGFIDSAPKQPIVLDQDPTAIPLVYSAMMSERLSLSPEELREHLGRLLQLEIDHARTLAGRVVIFLEASPKTLADRCAVKFASFPDKEFASELRDRFVQIFCNLPSTIVVDAERPVGDILEEVAAIVSKTVCAAA